VLVPGHYYNFVLVPGHYYNFCDSTRPLLQFLCQYPATITIFVIVPGHYYNFGLVPGHYYNLVLVPGHYYNFVLVPGHYYNFCASIEQQFESWHWMQHSQYIKSSVNRSFSFVLDICEGQ
jgi:hypothetical protein